MKLPTQNRSTLSISLVLAFGLAAIFCVPYLVPVRTGLSYSYMFGFHNRTAILLILSLIAGFALWTRGLGLVLPNTSTGESTLSRRTAILAIAFCAACATLVWFVSTQIVPLGEPQFFLDRLEMHRLGAHLYRDIQFDYGPIMFYPPVWIARLTPLSLPNSYFLTYVLQWALGTWFLWKAVQLAARGTAHATTIFVLLYAFFMPAIVLGGTNYTMLRFLPTVAAALAVFDLYQRGASLLAVFGLAIAGAVGMLFYSPEQGIALTLATLIFFLLCVRTRRPGTLAALACFLLLFAAAFWLDSKTGALDTVLAFGAGNFNFPLIATYQTILLLLLLIVAGCATWVGLRDHPAGHPLVYLVCLSLVSLPAAFARADTGHIIINTLGALLAALVVLSQYPALWRWTWPAVTLLMLITGGTQLAGYRTPFRERIYSAAFGDRYHSQPLDSIVTRLLALKGPNAKQQIIDRLHRSETPNPNAAALPPGAHLLAPMGVDRTVFPLAGDPEISTGHFWGLLPMFNLEMVQLKIDELAAHPGWPILLPSPDAPYCVEDPNAIRIGMKRLLFVPYMPHPRHTLTAAAPLCNYILAHYALSPYTSPVPNYYVWLPR